MKGFLKKIAVFVLTLCAGALIGLGVNTVQKVEKANAANVNINTTITEDNFLVYSAALRVVEGSYTPAVRYRIAMDKTTFENNYGKNGEIDQNLTTGILLAKKSVLGNNTLTMENAGASAETTTWWKEDVCLMDKDGDGVKEEVACMVSSMFVYNIPESDFGVNLIARAYINYNGVTTYSKQTGGVSLSWVAFQTYAEADGSVDVGTLTEQEKSVRDTYCKYELNYYVDGVKKNTLAGAENDSDPACLYWGEKLPQPATPSSSVDTGDFLGWYNRTGTVKWEFATQTALGTTNLYAKFGLKDPYMVTLSVNGTDAYLPLEYKTATGYETEYKGVAITLPKPERYGYRFEGWNTAENGTGTTVNSATYTCDGNTTLYAQWSNVCYLWLYYGERSTDYVYVEYPVGSVVSLEDLDALMKKIEAEKGETISTRETTKLGLPYTAKLEYWAYENDTLNDTYRKIEEPIYFYTDTPEVIVVARYDDYLARLEYTQASKDDYEADGDFDTDPSYITTGNVEYIFFDEGAPAGEMQMTLSFKAGKGGSVGFAFKMSPTTIE
ncbi:MAG: InlB B-repeat-containing protein, partial [Clostridia bacterium]|nr:InlB B-repeat-containing protein [Clostridia bacterium]